MNEWEWRSLEESLEERTPLESASAGGTELRPGDRIRLKPRAGGDIFDLALAGRAATVEAIEQDYEGRIHFAVVVDDDPGKDLGMLRQPGHRFFFAPEEVEPTLKILIAGVGNIFLGDDGFDCAVAGRLARRPPPNGARVVDFGKDALILQAHGSSEKLDALIELLRPFQLVELVRSGKLLMARGERVT